MCPSIRTLDRIPVSEMQIPFNLSIAQKLCFLCYHGSPSQSTSVRRKTCHASVQLLFGMIALFVRRELLFGSFRRFPKNRGVGVAVFEGSPIQYNNAFIQPFFTLVRDTKDRKTACTISFIIDNYDNDYRLFQFLELLQYSNHTAYRTASGHSILFNVVP